MNKLKDYNLNAFLLLLLLFVLLFCFSGCTTLDKAVKKVTATELNAKVAQQAINAKHEKVAAKNCAILYPVSESEVTKGSETVTETEETQTETVPCKDSEGKQVEYVEVPKVRIVTKTIHRTDTIRVRDRAQERVCVLEGLELQKALTKETEAHTATQEQLKAVTKHRNTLLWIIGVGLVLFIGLKFMLSR